MMTKRMRIAREKPAKRDLRNLTPESLKESFERRLNQVLHKSFPEVAKEWKIVIEFVAPSSDGQAPKGKEASE